jgi:LmbE family N-acetylglucosaminyl deacetylase
MRSSPTIASLGTILGVWAHPDDEAYLSAGLMALARRHGQRVAVVTATEGEAGNPDPVRWSSAELVRQRRLEMTAALAAVDVPARSHLNLGLPDGGLAAVHPAVGVTAVTRSIQRVRPDTIVTFGPDGITGHPDHVAVSYWTAAAWRTTGRRARLLHATLTVDFHRSWGQLNDRMAVWMTGAAPPATEQDELATAIHCHGALLDQKMAALRAHATQTAGLIAAVGDDTFARWWATESFVDGGPRAEEGEMAMASSRSAG